MIESIFSLAGAAAWVRTHGSDPRVIESIFSLAGAAAWVRTQGTASTGGRA